MLEDVYNYLLFLREYNPANVAQIGISMGLIP